MFPNGPALIKYLLTEAVLAGPNLNSTTTPYFQENCGKYTFEDQTGHWKKSMYAICLLS